MKRSIYLFVSRTIYASIHFYLATHQAISISLNLPSLSSVSGITHSLRFQTPQPRVQSSSNATSGVLAWLNVWPDLDKGGQNPYLYSDSKMMLKKVQDKNLDDFSGRISRNPQPFFCCWHALYYGFSPLVSDSY